MFVVILTSYYQQDQLRRKIVEQAKPVVANENNQEKEVNFSVAGGAVFVSSTENQWERGRNWFNSLRPESPQSGNSSSHGFHRLPWSMNTTPRFRGEYNPSTDGVPVWLLSYPPVEIRVTEIKILPK